MTLSHRSLLRRAALASVLLLSRLSVSAQSHSTNPPVDPKSAYTPLTRAERLNEFLKRTTSPLSLVNSGVSAGLGQWLDRPEEWGQGATGFGRRYASSFAQHVVRETLMYGLSSALHEDNRYVRSRESGTKQRIYNAMNGTFFARNDEGRKRFSFSRIGSYAGASMISRSWQPPSSDSLGTVPVNVATAIGINMGMNVVREFWPRKWQP